MNRLLNHKYINPSLAFLMLAFCFANIVTPTTAEAYPPPGTPNASATLTPNGANVSYNVTAGYITDSYDYTICDGGSGCDIRERWNQSPPNFAVIVWPTGNTCLSTFDPVVTCVPAFEVPLTYTDSTYQPPYLENPRGITYTNHYAVSANGTVPYSSGQLIEVVAYQDQFFEQCGYFGCQSYENNVWTVLASYYVTDPDFTCTVTTNNAVVDPGSSTTFNVLTQPSNGFASPVSYSASVSPSPANGPTVTPSTFSQTSPYSATPTTIDTVPTTPQGSYTITFTAVSGAITKTCGAVLTVNPAAGNFSLVISPAPEPPPNGIGPNTNPNRSNIGTPVRFQVFAECVGGFNGPINNIVAETSLVGANVSIGATTLTCGGTTIVTVSNTNAIPENQQSTITNIISESITVRGSGQL